jgi:hypothetical protein
MHNNNILNNSNILAVVSKLCTYQYGDLDNNSEVAAEAILLILNKFQYGYSICEKKMHKHVRDTAMTTTPIYLITSDFVVSAY